VNYRKLKYHT